MSINACIPVHGQSTHQSEKTLDLPLKKGSQTASVVPRVNPGDSDFGEEKMEEELETQGTESSWQTQGSSSSLAATEECQNFSNHFSHQADTTMPKIKSCCED